MQSAALLYTSYRVLLLMESSTEYKFSHTHTHNKQSLFLFQLGDDSLLFYFQLLQNKPLQQKSIPNNSKCLSLDFFTKRWKARTLNKALIKLDKRSEFIVLFKKSLSGLVGNTVRLMK